MRKSRFTEAQIIGILKQAEGGATVADLAREHGVSTATIYNWRAKFGGMDVSEAKRLKELEDENRRLKQMVADLSLDKEALKSALGKKW
jgi:putative transposase